MDRRKALATAGAVTGTLMAATLAAAANFGLLGLGEHGASEVGKLRATRIAEVVDGTGAGATTTTVAPEVEIRYEDVTVPAGAASDDHGDDENAQQPEDDRDGTTATAPGTLSGDATVTSVDDHADDESHDSIDAQRVDDHHSTEHEGAEDDD
jgi:hypothetical protein